MNDQRRAVFLDRDGTLNIEREGFIGDPGELELYPNAADSVSRLNEAGFAVVLITNQSGIGRGVVTRHQVEGVHDRLRELLGNVGGRLDGVYLCPHAPDANPACSCRKPAPGMLVEAARDLKLNLSDSYLVGDDRRDLAAASAVGVSPVLVKTGKAGRVREGETDLDPIVPAYVASDVGDAVDWILKQGA